MTIRLSILLVAISDDVALRLDGRFREEGVEVVFRRADTAETLAGALSEPLNLLIAGASPLLDVRMLVTELQIRSLDVPILVVTETGRSQAQFMRDGALDVFVASDLSRLVPVIRRELTAAVQRMQLSEQIVITHLLQEVDEFILRRDDFPVLVGHIAQRIIELFDFRLVWIGLKELDGSIDVVASAGAQGYLQDMPMRWDDAAPDHSVAGLAIRRGVPVSLPWDAPELAHLRDRAQRYGLRSILSLPLGVKGNVIGVLNIYSPHEQAFGEAVVQRLTAFASRVTVAMLAAREQQELRLLELAMSKAANAMFITRSDGAIEWMNEALTHFSGYSVQELLGQNPRIFGSGQHDARFWQEMWQAMLDGRVWSSDVVNRHRDGHLYTVNQNVSPLYDLSGRLSHFLAVQQDVSEKKRLEQEIHFMAYHDALTGLPNRILFHDRVQQAIVQARRSRKPLALMFMDLDGFKAVNDTCGHAKGDELLRQVADRMKASVRSGDTVARLAGDEFTVLLLDVQGAESVAQVAQKLLNSIARPFDLGDGQVVEVTLSIGISLYPKDASEAEALLNGADHAMYQAKNGGKNRYVFLSQIDDESPV
jgi:diguanylate cyclase (GGDEF)-like protein/PAS domain S-box-containing protein